jgi:hypothetical protein
MDGAREAAVRARSERDVQKKLVDDGIEKLVSELKVGGVCPICGHTIEHLHAHRGRAQRPVAEPRCGWPRTRAGRDGLPAASPRALRAVEKSCIIRCREKR